MSKRAKRAKKMPTLYYGWCVVMKDRHSIPYLHESEAKDHVNVMVRNWGYKRRELRIVPVRVTELPRKRAGKKGKP